MRLHRLSLLFVAAVTSTCTSHQEPPRDAPSGGVADHGARITYRFQGVADPARGTVRIRPLTEGSTSSLSQALAEIPLDDDAGTPDSVELVGTDAGAVITGGCVRGGETVDSFDADVTLRSHFSTPLTNVIVKITAVSPASGRAICESAVVDGVTHDYGLIAYGDVGASGTSYEAATVTWQFAIPDRTAFAFTGIVLADVVTNAQAPVAADDAYPVLFGTEVSRAATDADDLLDNDELGLPAAGLISFGGGSLGGDVTDHVSGTAVEFGTTGSLLVNDDGSFTFFPDEGFVGDFTFDYRLEGVSGRSDATVTFEVRQQAPEAVNDGPIVVFAGATRTIAANDADALLTNDLRGAPAATISSFGGGSLGGAVTDLAVGSSVSVAGGSLTVNADGSLTLDGLSTTGAHTFLYRLENPAGSSDATVTIEVQAPPLANDDSYAALPDTTVQRAASDTDDLLDNDELGAPAATIESFGGLDAGGTVTSNAAGTTMAAAGGSLTVNADGSFVVTPPAGFAGAFSFQYRLSNAAGTSDATVTVRFHEPPTASDDGTYFAVVGSTLSVTSSAADDLLGNDDLGRPAGTITSFGAGSLGGAVTDVAAGSSASVAGGTLTVSTDGGFSLAAPTETGTFTFSYRLENTAGSSDATVTITVRRMPQAVADGPYVVEVGSVLTVDALLDGDLLDNDDLGDPAATLTHFGAGDPAEQNADGILSVTLAGGTLTVSPDGGFTLDTPVTPGVHTFRYRLTNAAGTSDGVATVEVQERPVAANDGPYVIAVNGTLTVATSDDNDLLDNDTLGSPAAAVSSFGGGSLGGAVTDYAAGTEVSVAGGLLRVEADGSFRLVGPTAFGAITFDYRLTNAAGTSDATVTIHVTAAPSAVDDGPYLVEVAQTLTVAPADANDLLDNDDLGFPVATVQSFGLTDATEQAASGTDSIALAGGTLVVNADGGFTLTGPTTPGVFTFVYRMGNGVGTSDAQVTIDVRVDPTAANDGVYAVLVNGTLSIAASDANDLLDNDVLGVPEGSLESFGGGALGGSVIDHAAGSTVALAGGTLAVNADGSFALDGPTTAGAYTFQYRLSNPTGSSDATVGIEVRRLPAAQDDGPYIVEVSQTLDVATSADTDLLDNDDTGFPAGTITSFGAVTATEITVNGTNSMALAGGTLVVRADGSFTLTNPTTPGAHTFRYRLTNAAGTSDAVVALNVRQDPVAVDDGPYTLSINDTLVIATTDANDLLDNDTRGTPAASIASFGGGSLGGAVTDHAAGSPATLGGGTLTVNADGSFTIAAPTTSGTYTFVYRLQNAAGSSDATVAIVVQRAPAAVDDGVFAVEINQTLTVDTTATNDLLDNDDRGVPAATIASFGVTLPTEAAANGTNTLALAGGTLLVRADGSFSLANPTVTGQHTFRYRLTNSAGSSDATVTLEVRKRPVATADGVYTLRLGTTLTVPTSAPNDLLDNDDLGSPAATIASFGVAAPTEVPANGSTSVMLAGGLLRVYSDGSFTFSNPTTAGDFTFRYRLSNAAGSSDAVVSVRVRQLPVAVDDGPVVTSAPGDAFHTALNTTLDSSTHTTPSVAANDTLGFPAASVSGPAATTRGGTLSIGPAGEFVYTPPNNATGLDTFTYVLTNDEGSSTATVTIAIGARPSAGTLNGVPVTGNVKIDTSRGTPTLLPAGGDRITLTLTSATTSRGSALTIDSPSRTFTYDPFAGITGADTFGYTVTNGFGAVDGTVNLTITDMIWFVDDGAAGDGRLTSPLATLPSLTGKAAIGEVIYVHSGTYNAGITLLQGQKLVGQGADLASLLSGFGITLAPHSIPLPAVGTRPVISGAAPLITLAQDVTVRDLDVNGTSGSSAAMLANNTGGTLTITNVQVTGNTASGFGATITGALNLTNFDAMANAGIALSVGGGTLSVAPGVDGSSINATNATGLSLSNTTIAAGGAAFASVRSSGTGAGIILSAVSGGPVTVAAGTLTNKTSGAINLSGGNSAFTCNAVINHSASSAGIVVANKSGGAVSFGNAITLSTGSQSGVSLTSNPASAVSFTGGLVITTTSGTALVATGNSSLVVTGTNTISATVGRGLVVENTTIGSGGLVFRSISVNGGSAGIRLLNTGATAGLQVAGTGAAGSGGTIQNVTADGIFLQQTRDVALTSMNVLNNVGSGIYGNDVTNFSLTSSTVAGNDSNDADGAIPREAGLRFGNLLGTCAISSSTISNTKGDNVRIEPSSGTLTGLQIRSSTIGPSAAASFGNGLAVVASGTAAVTLGVLDTTFTANPGSALLTTFADTSNLDLSVTGSRFNDNGVGLDIGLSKLGSSVVTLSGNTLLRQKGNAIGVFSDGTAYSGAEGNARVTVASNVIGDGNIDSGSRDAYGIQVDMRGDMDAIFSITGNTIQHTDVDGIYIQSRLDNLDFDSTRAVVDVTLRNNTVDFIDDNSSVPFNDVNGVRIEARNTTNLCLDIAANDSTSKGFRRDFRTRQLDTSTFRLERLTGAANDPVNVANQVAAQNVVGSTAEATLVTTYTAVPDGTCRNP